MDKIVRAANEREALRHAPNLGTLLKGGALVVSRVDATYIGAGKYHVEWWVSDTEGRAMAKKTSKHRPIETGLRGTDNCPVCGRAMKKQERTLLGRSVLVVSCRQEDHEAQVMIPKAPAPD